MARKRKPKMEYRYYEIPAGSPVLALLGDKWVQNYGREIDYLHFHNHLEVGFCYYGEGTVTFKEEDLPFWELLLEIEFHIANRINMISMYIRCEPNF